MILLGTTKELCNTGSVEDRLSCVAEMVDSLKTNVEPRILTPFEQWPGNELCIECNFFGGLALSIVEIGLFYFIWHLVHEVSVLNPYKKHRKLLFFGSTSLSDSLISKGLTLLSVLGWTYYTVITSIYWNFVSYLMLSGLVFVAPGLVSVCRSKSPGLLKSAMIKRRVKASGLMLGVITLALFPNVLLVPSQIERHLDPAYKVITPDHPSVIRLKEMFYEEHPKEEFDQLDFNKQMLTVDFFIFDKIHWQQDYSIYGMVGLLVTPEEVISKMTGDCQGQAAVTTSLLISMEFEAYMVETPFHWWTHAREKTTGEEFNLNVHGHAGNNGNVLPQPIDLVFTHPKLTCENCPEIDSHNHQAVLYAAPPHRNLFNAYSGSHIMVRSGLAITEVSIPYLFTVGTGLGILAAVYSSYSLGDSNIKRFVKRAALGTVIGVGPLCFGTSVWVTVYYPVALIHAVSVLSWMLTFLSSDQYNRFLIYDLMQDANRRRKTTKFDV
eukprot:TRINITY_DN11804_c0_g1_i1.p2 TRINITY_DN11804_c0_g1~~TRINITY_DN11804_c0_g1_i1.p2  ORF type:complete len:495 (-),score=42.71 TRINITY_DN11804_c0_g1_i1:45-1529(-)